MSRSKPARSTASSKEEGNSPQPVGMATASTNNSNPASSAKAITVNTLQNGKAERSQLNCNIKGTIERNFSAYCSAKGISKTEVITALLCDFLRTQGLDPDKEPKVVN